MNKCCLTDARMMKKISDVTRVTSPISRRPCCNVYGRKMMLHALHFLESISTSMMCSLEIRSCLSDCCLWRFLAKGDNCWLHFGHDVNSVENDLGQLARRQSVSAALYLIITLKIDLSGSSVDSRRYSAVFLMYRCVRLHSKLCLSQSFSCVRVRIFSQFHNYALSFNWNQEAVSNNVNVWSPTISKSVFLNISVSPECL